MKPDQRRTGPAMAALLILGGALRLYGFSAHALWIDEYGTAWAVAGSGAGDLFDRVLAVHGQSPFYYALVRGSVALFGADATGLRLPSLVCGLLLLLLAVPLGRALFRDERAAVGALAVFAVHERFIYYSQEARPYAMALLLSAASFWCFAHLLRDARARRWQVAWVLCTAATLYTHYLFSVALLAQLFYLAWRGARGLPQWRAWLGATGALALLCAPTLWQLASLMERRRSLDWVDRSASDALSVLAGFVDLPVLAPCAVAVAACAWAAGGLRRPPRGSRIGLVALWLALPFACVSLVARLLDVNLVHPRYLLASLPAVALLLGASLSLARSRARLDWLPLVVFLACVAALRLVPQVESNGLFSQRRTQERWDLASRALLQRHQPGDPIYYQTKFVELDAVVRGEAGERVTEFTTWPVASHLPQALRSSLVALPAGDDPEMRQALRERVADAALHPRSFVVLTRDSLARVLAEIRRRPDLTVAQHLKFGFVHLIALRGSDR